MEKRCSENLTNYQKTALQIFEDCCI